MYHFRITRQDNGEFRFELDGIKLLVDDYSIKGNKHLIKNPQKAIAFFNCENNLYGISNEPTLFETAEAFYDAISKQYLMLADEVHHLSHT